MKKFSYDLWGEAVNLASRLQSNAPPGGILISESTYKIVSDIYMFESQGDKNLKGIGKVSTWVVLGKDNQ